MAIEKLEVQLLKQKLTQTADGGRLLAVIH